LEQYLADLNVSVGDEASSREGLMVEIRVASADVTVARRRLRPGRRSVAIVGPLPIAGVP